MKRYLWIFGVFVVLLVFLGVGLTLNPREVPSPLIGKPAPAFDLPQLHRPEVKTATADMKGKVWLLNVWASWCAACRQEHPVLMELARTGVVPIVGFDYKDQRDAGLAVLRQNGDPYALTVVDVDGRAAIDWGVYGVPESFLVDKRGVIRYKQIGPVTPEAWRDKILPLVRELNAAS
jgi:cytochrome c biogenesis protein CcmG/thiol:disulfide interchange protein DsbE